MMNLLSWKPEYALGIPSVDLEHREMIELINSAHARLNIVTNAAADRDAVAAMLGEIHAGIAAHFALEELLMRTSKYGEYAAHKQDHERLLGQILDLMDMFVADPEQGRQQLAHRLSGWFGGHFATFDARMHGELVQSKAHR